MTRTMDCKIHVLQIIGEFTSGGAESVVLNLARCIDSNSVNLKLSARKDGPLSKKVPARSEIFIIPKRGRVDGHHLLELAQIIKNHNIDIVHAHLFGPNLYGFLAAKMSGTKIVQTIHGQDDFSGRKRRSCYQLMAPMVDAVVAVSEPLRDDFAKHIRIGRRKLQVIHNGIDVTAFNVNKADSSEKLKEMGIPENAKVVGTVGNIKPVKGIDILIRAFEKVAKGEERDTALVIVGEIFPQYADYKKELDDLVAGLRLNGRVFFAGFREDISELLHNMDVFVLSSRTEGLPISLLEAMAAGKAVIATDVGMNSQIINDGVNGRLVKSEDVVSISRGILEVLTDQKRSDHYGKRAAETIEKEFSSEKMATQYAELYWRLVTVR